MNPIERSAMAMIPASKPGPRIATSRSAQIRALTEREATMMKTATGRTNRTLGVVLRAARKATGTARRIASRCPECGDVDGVPKRRPKLVHVGPARRHHPSIRSAACSGASHTKAQI
jgi:hypothetical protein